MNNVLIKKSVLLFLLCVFAIVFFQRFTPIGTGMKFHSSYGRSDYTVFYATGLVVRSGESPYTKQPLKKTIRAIRDYDAGWRFFYSPPTALALTPFSFLPYRFSIKLWFVLSLIALFGVGWLLMATFAKKQWLLSCVIFFGILSVYGAVGTNLRLGQINIFILLFFTAHIAAGKKEWAAISGVLLACCSIVKLFPFALLGYYVLRKDWRVVASTVCTTMVAFAVSFVVLGQEVHEKFLQKIQAVSGKGLAQTLETLAAFDNASVYGASVRLLMNTTELPLETVAEYASMARYGIVGSLGLLVALMTYVKRKQAFSAVDLSLWVGIALLGLVEIHTQYTLFFMPTFFILLMQIFEKQLSVWFVVPYATSLLLIGFSYMRYLPDEIKESSLIHIPFATVGMLLLFCTVLLQFYMLRTRTTQIPVKAHTPLQT